MKDTIILQQSNNLHNSFSTICFLMINILTIEKFYKGKQYSL